LFPSEEAVDLFSSCAFFNQSLAAWDPAELLIGSKTFFDLIGSKAFFDLIGWISGLFDLIGWSFVGDFEADSVDFGDSFFGLSY